MVRAAGIAARAQGLRRHYALLVAANDTVRLIKELDGSTVLAEAEVAQVFGRPSELALDVEGIACKRASTGRCCSTSSTAVRRSRVAPWPSSARTAA